MKIRRLIVAAGVAAALPQLGGEAHGAATPVYPDRPVRIVVGFPPGGTADILARGFGREMTEAWGQSVVVENRPGAGSLIGSEYVAKSAPDGYTLLVVTSSHAVAATTLGKKDSVDPVEAFTPISLLATTPLALVANPRVPATSMRELMAVAKRSPGKINYGSSGTGSTTHLAGELLSQMAGIRLVHVPYKGGAHSMNDLVSGQIDLLVISWPSAIPQIKAGKAKGLGISALKRSPVLPQIPTLAEAVPGYEALQWYALLGPAGMPADIVQKLNAQVVRTARSAQYVDLISKLGADSETNTPTEFRAFLRSEVAKWTKVARQLDLGQS